MKNKKKLLCIFLLLIVFSLQGCSAASAYTDERNEFWIKDMEYVQHNLPIRHANLFANITKEEFNSQMDKLKKDIPSINDDEIQIRLMEILAPAEDAHLLIMNFAADMMKHFSAETFYSLKLKSNMDYILPIKTKWFGDELIITEVHSDYKEILGARLEKINNKPIEDVIEKINTLIPHNNEQRLKFLNVMFLSHPQVLRHFNLLKGESLSMEFKNMDGKIIKKNIKVMNTNDVHFMSVMDNQKEKPLYMTKNDLYWYEYLPEAKAVYFKLSTYGEMEVLNKRNYNKESNKSSGERARDFGDFASFLEDMIAFMKDNKPEKLVIDLRGNNGGIPSILKGLREYIEWDSDFPEKGSVFLLVDKGSFSAPILECTFYKDNLKAIVVGEPTGERPFVFGGGGADTMMLPNSRVSILYSAGEFAPIDKNIDSVVPDIVVNVSFEEYRNGIDPVLKAALDYPIK